MRVEWAKSKARAERWSEEVLLLTEEMRRVIQYFDWKSKWWLVQRDRRTDAHPDVRYGIKAYAEKQAAMFCDMGKAFARRWHPLLVKNNIPVDWPDEYTPDQTHLPLASVLTQMDLD